MLVRIVMLVSLFSLVSVSVDSFGQSKSMKDIERRSGTSERSIKRTESKKVRQAKENAEEKKEKQKERYEKAKKDDNERRYNMQTPGTKQRMKETKKQAEEFNNKGHESFFKRLFKRKKP